MKELWLGIVIAVMIMFLVAVFDSEPEVRVLPGMTITGSK